ncbi:KTSC domain-containing protein [Sphingobium bisphenolivorans]|uniref:KTSC domain-containing protein n=1 Tax=Sphingobium bisphenolivorans TaxID=1335760 RepID=UPI0003A1193A|nr:KTSC domain-containing protein [Sphingobium bisphenolivorans]
MPSTVIQRFDYDRAEHRLDVQFVSGKRYSYFDVPEKLVADMQQASSKGSFFNRRIRDHYRFIRL